MTIFEYLLFLCEAFVFWLFDVESENTWYRIDRTADGKRVQGR
jgi:hypothetical protein